MAVLFDPGYSKCTLSVGKTFEELHRVLAGSHSLTRKKTGFKTLYPKVKRAIEENIAFYFGCLLWAIYLKTQKNEEILNNPCVDTVYDKEGCLYEINALLAYVKEGLNRDSKYYLNETYTPDPGHLKILEVYREFLDLNKGFHNTKITEDIALPDELKTPDKKELDEIVKTIHQCIERENISELLKFYNSVF